MASSSRLFALILCIVLVQGVQAIDIGFSASNGGKSVSIWDSYLVDDSLSVSESASATFNSVEMANSRDISGSGDLNVKQKYLGSDGYTGYNYVNSEDTSSLGITSSETLTPETLEASQRVSLTGSDTALTFGGLLGVKETRQSVGVDSSGSLSSEQGLSIGTGVHSSQSLTASSTGATSVTAYATDGTDICNVETTVSGGQVSGDLSVSVASPPSISEQIVASFYDDYFRISRSDEYGHNVHLRDTYTAIESSHSVEVGRKVSGSGNANMNLGLSSLEGSYSTSIKLRTEDAKRLVDESVATLSPTSCYIERNTNIYDGDLAEIELQGHQDGSAYAWARMENGNMKSDQELAIGNSVQVSQSPELNAQLGYTNIYARAKDGICASTTASMVNCGGHTGTLNSAVQEAKTEPVVTAEQKNTNINADLGIVYGSAVNNEPAYEKSFSLPLVDYTHYNTVYNGEATFRAAKQYGVMNAEVESIASSNSVDINADTSLSKDAIIIEPMYTQFSGNLKYPPLYCHSSHGTAGDTVEWYLALSEYETWRYMDSAVTSDKFKDLDEYNVVLLSSHMTSSSISLSGSKGQSYSAARLDRYYDSPPTESLVIFDGCKSAEPNSAGGNSELFDAVSEAGTIAGYAGNVDVKWGARDSIGMLFEYMYGWSPTYGGPIDIAKAQTKVWNDYRPDYGLRPNIESLVIDGDKHWTLGGPNNWILVYEDSPAFGGGSTQ